MVSRIYREIQSFSEQSEAKYICNKKKKPSPLWGEPTPWCLPAQWTQRPGFPPCCPSRQMPWLGNVKMGRGNKTKEISMKNIGGLDSLFNDETKTKHPNSSLLGVWRNLEKMGVEVIFFIHIETCCSRAMLKWAGGGDEGKFNEFWHKEGTKHDLVPIKE